LDFQVCIFPPLYWHPISDENINSLLLSHISINSAGMPGTPSYFNDSTTFFAWSRCFVARNCFFEMYFLVTLLHKNYPIVKERISKSLDPFITSWRFQDKIKQDNEKVKDCRLALTIYLGSMSFI